MKDKLSKWIKENKPKVITIIALSVMLVIIGGIGIANSLNSKEVANETIEETKKEIAKESKKETKKEEPKVSKKVEEKVNKELDKEVEKIKAKNLSKEEEQKEIEKATEKVIEKVAKEEKIDKTILTSSIKETVKETQKETKKEVATSKPSTQNKSSSNNNTAVKPKEENKVETKPSTNQNTQKKPETKKETVKETQKEQSKNQIVVKRETKRDIISYGTQRAYYIDGAKTRVKRQGQNGYKDTFYDVEYTNGKETNRTVVDTKYQAPVDEIIETYVKVQDEVWETQMLEDKNQPVYERIVKDRWFVRNQDTGEVTYFYSAKEAEDYYGELSREYLVNWGTAEQEVTYDYDKLLGYRKVEQNVKVQDEIWDWR